VLVQPAVVLAAAPLLAVPAVVPAVPSLGECHPRSARIDSMPMSFQLEAGGPATTEEVAGVRPPMDRMPQGMSLPCQVESPGLEHVAEELEEDKEALHVTQLLWHKG
jgi:hypothetical protein